MPPRQRSPKSTTTTRRPAAKKTTTTTARKAATSRPAAIPPDQVDTTTITAPMPGFMRETDLDPHETAADFAAADSFDEPAGATPAFPTDDELGPDLDDAPATIRAAKWKLPKIGFRVRTGSPDPATRGLCYGILRAALTTFGAAVHQRAAADLKHGPNAAWLMDEQDVETIGGALANIAARRAPTGLGGQGDAADLLDLVIGVGGYTMKGLTAQTDLARRRAMTAAGPLEYGDPPGVAWLFQLAAGFAVGRLLYSVAEVNLRRGYRAGRREGYARGRADEAHRLDRELDELGPQLDPTP